MELTNEEKEKIWSRMYEEHLRLLGLCELRLYYLETMSDNLELCRHMATLPVRERADLAATYRAHFKNKIQSILFDIKNIIAKNEEYLRDYMA